jgi:hypothetical protein
MSVGVAVWRGSDERFVHEDREDVEPAVRCVRLIVPDDLLAPTRIAGVQNTSRKHHVVLVIHAKGVQVGFKRFNLNSCIRGEVARLLDPLSRQIERMHPISISREEDGVSAFATSHIEQGQRASRWVPSEHLKARVGWTHGPVEPVLPIFPVVDRAGLRRRVHDGWRLPPAHVRSRLVLQIRGQNARQRLPTTANRLRGSEMPHTFASGTTGISRRRQGADGEHPSGFT